MLVFFPPRFPPTKLTQKTQNAFSKRCSLFETSGVGWNFPNLARCFVPLLGHSRQPDSWMSSFWDAIPSPTSNLQSASHEMWMRRSPKFLAGSLAYLHIFVGNYCFNWVNPSTYIYPEASAVTHLECCEPFKNSRTCQVPGK